MSNQFDAWVKDKVVIFPCGCEVHHGSNPITGHLKFCKGHVAEIAQIAVDPAVAEWLDSKPAPAMTIDQIRAAIDQPMPKLGE